MSSLLNPAALTRLLIHFLPSQQRASTRTNTETFAGAVGGIVGLLFLLSLGLAIILYRKRRVARTRPTLPTRDDASSFTESSDDLPQMEGPSSFIPRYFSDTVHPLPPQEGQSFPRSRNSDASTDYAERPPLTRPDSALHRATIPNVPLPVYIPSRAMHHSV